MVRTEGLPILVVTVHYMYIEEKPTFNMVWLPTQVYYSTESSMKMWEKTSRILLFIDNGSSLPPLGSLPPDVL